MSDILRICCDIIQQLFVQKRYMADNAKMPEMSNPFPKTISRDPQFSPIQAISHASLG